MMKDYICNAIIDAGYSIRHERLVEARPSISVPYDDMKVSEKTMNFIKSSNIPSLWRHQRIAVEKALDGNNVCVSTSTSSGKTEIFQMVACEILARNPESKVLAVYSAKALNSQQRERWERTGFSIGQIDGSDTNYNNRLNTIQNSRVVVMTPDVMQTFLLGNFANTNLNRPIIEFIKHVELCIIDEIHLYRGVFGTNSAYLFRRFNNIRRNLRKDLSFPIYVTASATLPNPAQHSEDITGAPNFINVGKDLDGSPTSKTHYFYIQPSDSGVNAFTKIAKMQLKIAELDDARSITFVESRQRTGEIVLATGDDITVELEAHKIYPYRAGMEEQTRAEILDRMNRGQFKGVVSTSALEIGIDIKGLNVAILANLPYDLNSYYQRVGRVGRGSCPESYVIIVNDTSFKSDLLFGDFDFDIERLLPDLEPALYLESMNVQYVHASCHADSDKDCCELTACHGDVLDTNMEKYFPHEFCQTCRQVYNHQAPREYDRFADTDSPHYVFSLRNNGDNYSFVKESGEVVAGESVTRQQLFKEAYKGAIRNITQRLPTGINTFNQEVVRIDKLSKVVVVKNINDTRTTTKPVTKVILYPNFSSDRRYKTASCGECVFFNLELYEKVEILGYRKNFFGNTQNITYHKPHIDTLRTTGTLLFHPSLNQVGVNRSQVVQLIFETFLMRNAFDRNDINDKPGKLYVSVARENLRIGDRFVALYDINQLNITSHLLKEDILRDTFQYLSKYIDTLAESIFENEMKVETREAVLAICESVLNNDFVYENCVEIARYIPVFSLRSVAQFCPDPSEEDSDSDDKWMDCSVLAVFKDEIPNTVKYLIFCNGDFIYDVTSEKLRQTLLSQMQDYDWKNGVYVN